MTRRSASIVRQPAALAVGTLAITLALGLGVAPAAAGVQQARTASRHKTTADTAPPTPPAKLVARRGSRTVSLSWRASRDRTDGVAGYRVYRDGHRIGRTQRRAFTDRGLAAGTLYTFYVVAYDSSGHVSARSNSVSATPATSSLSPAIPGAWTLKFDDEFNATTLDLAHWQPNWLGPDNTTTTPSPDEPDLNCIDPAEVSEGGGSLTLMAVQRSCTADNGRTYQYASALVNTYNSFRFTYGYMEARIYLASAGGKPVDFPAFWADGAGTWPHTGELDVMEVLRSCGPGVGYHFHSDAGGPGHCVHLRDPTGWHTFGANWKPGVVTYYYDGRQVGQIRTGITAAPMYLILNNSVDSAVGGANSSAAALRVDYIRVWQ